jgi:hypothetical protein
VTIPSAASPAEWERKSNELAGDMIGVHGAGAAGVARGNARAAALAGRVVEARNWLQLVDTIQRRMVRPVRDVLRAMRDP